MSSSVVASWAALLSVALTGTARNAQPLPALPGVPAPDPADAAAPPRQLLRAAAALGVVERAGFRAPAWEADPPAPAPPDSRPTLGLTGTDLLAQQFASPVQTGAHVDRIRFALWHLAARGRRLPPQLLPALLAQQRGPVVELEYLLGLSDVLGSRGRWLTGLAARFTQPVAPDPDDYWQRSDRFARGRLLEQLAVSNLPLAVRLLITYLPGTPVDDRFFLANGFLGGLQKLLPPLPDLPAWPELRLLLETLLATGERDNAFLNAAMQLLALLPGSELVPALGEWITAHLAPASGPDGSPVLHLASPVCPPPSPLRNWLQQYQNVPDDAPAQWLKNLLHLLPPSYLSAAWHLSAAEVLALAYTSPEAGWLVDALYGGLGLHRDEPFALAFLNQPPPPTAAEEPWHSSLSHYAARLSPATLIRWTLTHLAESPRPGWPAPHALLALSNLRPLGGWPPALVRPVFEFLLDRLEQAPPPEQEWLADYAPEILRPWGHDQEVCDPALLPLLPRLKPFSKKPPGHGEWTPLVLHSTVLLDALPFRAQFAASLSEPLVPAT